MNSSDDLYAQFAELLELDDDAQQIRLAALRAQQPELASRLQQLLGHDQQFQSASRQGDTLSWLAQEPVAKIIGDFQLLAPIGSGGMGRVYKAIRLGDESGQIYALKLIHSELLSESVRQRFALECEALASLQHPGIARFVESGQTALGIPYVVMEYVEGEPIDHWCDRQRLSIDARIQLLRKLAEAVAHAHSHLIVHRDIKAANVLVDQHGKVTLVDFGIAKSLTAAPHATATADRFLSPLSAAPEQLLGTPVGTGCDVYGLGLLLYRLLSGAEPFDFGDCDPAAIQRLIIWQPAPEMTQRLQKANTHVAQNRGLPDIKSLQDALRGDISQITLRCLRKQPQERYASVIQLEQDLGRVLAGQPISGRESEYWYRARKFLQRNRAAVSSVVLSLFALVGSLIWSLQQERRAVHERDRAENAVSLLKQAFAAANPMQIEGGNITVRQVLDAALPLIEARRSSQPGLYADLAATLADVELATGQPQRALKLADQALDAAAQADLAQVVRQPMHLVAAKATLNVGLLADMDRRLAQLAPTNTDQKVEQWLLRSGLATLRGDYEQAESVLTQAYAAIKSRSGDDPMAIAVREQLAQVYLLRDHRDRAIQLTEEALAVQAVHLPENHPRMLLTRMRWLNYQMPLQPPAELLPQVQALREQIENVFGAHSVPLARVIGLLARLHLALREDAQGTEYFREQLRIWEIATSAGNSNTLRTRFNLALMLSETGRDDAEAESHYLQLLAQADQDNQLAPGFWRFWRVKYLEFLSARQRCKDTLSLSQQYFPPSDSLEMDERNQQLLQQVLGQTLQQCQCQPNSAEQTCAAAYALHERLPSAPASK